MRTPTNEQFQEVFPGDSRRVLEEAEQFVLLSLDPKRLDRPAEGSFHGYRVVGQTPVSDPRRKELIVALYDGIAEDASPARCFIPHHGIRAVRGKQTLDLVICFTCSQMHVHVPGASDHEWKWATVAETPMQTFDRALTEAGVPLGEREY
jgi:hypothetical protein